MSTLRGISANAPPPDGAEAPVFASIDLYRAYWDASVDRLFAIRVTPEGEFLCGGFNPALELATGLSSKNTVGKPPEAFLEPQTAEAFVSLYRACLAAEAPVSRTVALRMPAGARICIVSAIPIRGPSGAIELLLGRTQDVTEVQRLQVELSNLTERLLDVQEEERLRIAVELHDSTSQHLVAVQLELGALRRRPLTDESLSRMNSALAEAHREIRTLSYQLIPPRLAEDCLTKTLRDFAHGFARRTGMAIDLRLEGGIDTLPYRIQRALFRIAQEALSNSHRHGDAKDAVVELSVTGEGLKLAITDNGSPPALPIVRGVGISGMEVRIERFGGSLSVTPTRSGTAVLAAIPASALSALS